MIASTDRKINKSGDAGNGNPVDDQDGGRDGGRVDNRVADRGGSGTGNVVALRPGLEPGSVAAAVEVALTAFGAHLDRCALAANTVTSYRRQALAAVTLLYEHGPALRLAVKHARVPKPGAPDALTRAQENAVRRAADRRGSRDAALIALLLGSGARAEECQRLRISDIPDTACSGTARLHGKGPGCQDGRI